MKTMKVKWTGIRPLIMHNGMLADPLWAPAKELAEVTSKKKKSEEDHLLMGRLEWEAGLYWDDETGPYIPADNIERCIQLGAQKNKKGKEVQAAVLVSDDIIPLAYKGPKDKAALYADGRFQIRKGIVVSRQRVQRTRPMFPPGWSIQPTLEFDETVISADNLLLAMRQAGALIGLGDWRPKFGRFLVEA